MATKRGWSPDDGENKGRDAREAETDRLNATSNAQQQRGSNAPDGPPAGEAPAPGSVAPTKP